MDYSFPQYLDLINTLLNRKGVKEEINREIQNVFENKKVLYQCLWEKLEILLRKILLNYILYSKFSNISMNYSILQIKKVLK